MVKAQPLSGSLLNLLISPSGAIDRGCFVGGSLVLCAVALASDRLARLATDSIGLLSFLFALALLWSAGCLCRKRLHDIGRSGWLIIAFLAAYIALVLAAPFIFSLTTTGSWRHARFVTIVLAAPMVAWLTWLAIVPGEAARLAARLAGPAEPKAAHSKRASMARSLRAGRM